MSKIEEIAVRDITEEQCSSLTKSEFWRSFYRFETGSGAYRSYTEDHDQRESDRECVNYRFMVVNTEDDSSISLTKYEGVEGWNMCVSIRVSNGNVFASQVIDWLLDHGLVIARHVQYENGRKDTHVYLPKVLFILSF